MLSLNQKLLLIQLFVSLIIFVAIGFTLWLMMRLRSAWPDTIGDAGMALISIIILLLVSYASLRIGATLEQRWAGLPPA